MVQCVKSGGQTGGDQGFLLAAESLGIPTSGWAPAGWRTDAGAAPWLGTRFGLREHVQYAYPPRTADNVRDSDGTIIFGYAYSQGCALTQRLCARGGKPFLLVPWPGEANVTAARAWLEQHNIIVLNGAGNRERTHPGIQAASMAFAVELLRKR